MIKRQTQVDPVLSKVYRFVISGWPRVVDPSFVPFKTKRGELTAQQGCILWGTRVVVRSSLQEKVLNELNETPDPAYKNLDSPCETPTFTYHERHYPIRVNRGLPSHLKTMS